MKKYLNLKFLFMFKTKEVIFRRKKTFVLEIESFELKFQCKIYIKLSVDSNVN